MKNVLTIEGSERVTHNFVPALMEGGFSVDVAYSGRAGMSQVMAQPYDAVILDRTLPDLDALAVVTHLRGIGMDIPVLMMSATSEVGERIEGLRAGADDYLCMPFSCEEMLVRMEVLLRRRKNLPAEQTVLRVDALELNLVKRMMTHGQTTQTLQTTEFRVLEFMMRRPGQVLTRTMILEAIWGFHFDPSTNVIDVHVGQLRKKLAALGTRPMIHTIRGVGYRLR
ncbi:response regulator transcription factor [Paraburkholderia sp.]|jgi:DNA-binding response OmpR family regulator|uniref:response regulator transcription factor n=1 Tax=Paraburkholderia sp. TaxID=1926495 RepID=UPI002F428CBF